MDKHEAWPRNIIGYIKAMHNVDFVWKPKNPTDEPPF